MPQMTSKTGAIASRQLIPVHGGETGLNDLHRVGIGHVFAQYFCIFQHRRIPMLKSIRFVNLAGRFHDVLPQGIEVGIDVSESFDLSRNNSSFLGHFNKVSTGEDHAGRKIKKALGGKMPVPKIMPKKVRDKFNYNPIKYNRFTRVKVK